jgi:hypothetical protein
MPLSRYPMTEVSSVTDYYNQLNNYMFHLRSRDIEYQVIRKKATE